MESMNAYNPDRYYPLSGATASGTPMLDISDARESRRKKLEKAVSGFEQMMLNMMMKEMNKTVHKTGLFHGGNAEEIYTDFFTSTVAEEAAQQSPLGLKNVLIRQLDKLYTENDKQIGKKQSSRSAETPILHFKG